MTFLQTKRLSFRAASYQLVYLVRFQWEKNSFMKTIEGKSSDVFRDLGKMILSAEWL